MIDTTEELIPITDQTQLPPKIQSSRYYLSKVYASGSNKFYETWDIPEIPYSPTDKFHEITSGEEGRWDLISYHHYGSVLFLWVVCVANNIRNPLEILPAGTVLRIPDPATIYKITVLKDLESKQTSY